MSSARRLYKRERRPARDQGVLHAAAPVACPDANAGEVAKAIFAIAREAGVVVGRAAGYEQIRDEYTVIGKSRATGKAQDFRVMGADVATAIRIFRVLNGGKAVRGKLRA